MLPTDKWHHTILYTVLRSLQVTRGQPNAWKKVIFQVQLYNKTKLCYSTGSPARQGGQAMLLTLLGWEGQKHKYDSKSHLTSTPPHCPLSSSAPLGDNNTKSNGDGRGAHCRPCTPCGTRADYLGRLIPCHYLLLSHPFLSPCNTNSRFGWVWLQKFGSFRGVQRQWRARSMWGKGSQSSDISRTKKSAKHWGCIGTSH